MQLLQLLLPDEIGGIRNWDYRYVWVRDAAFTLYAFYVTDYVDEAVKFFKFIKKAASDNKENEFELNVVYSIWGKSAPDETELDNLTGYKNSKPVKVGNNATNQFQLDIYGNLIDAHYFISKREKDNVTVDKKLIKTLLKKIEENWMTKDSGIWEMRGNKYHYTYSKVMCWVGVDRSLRMKNELELSDEEINKLKKLRQEIKDWIWENCFDEEKQNFVQYKGSKDIDATNLLFVLLQFLDKNDSRTKTIIDNTVNVLCKNEVFVYRYLADDGLKGKDNAFILCSYWMISAYAIIGETDKAEDLFKKLNEHFDKSGLISEQMNQDNFEYLGNFPQAFSHLGYLMSAYYINRYSNKKS